MTTTKAPKYPAAFINAIAEEGTKEEAIQYLQQTWDELQDALKDAAKYKAALERIAGMTDVSDNCAHCGRKTGIAAVHFCATKAIAKEQGGE